MSHTVNQVGEYGELNNSFNNKMDDQHEKYIKERMRNIGLIIDKYEDARIKSIQIEIELTNTYWQGFQDGIEKMREIYNP